MQLKENPIKVKAKELFPNEAEDFIQTPLVQIEIRRLQVAHEQVDLEVHQQMPRLGRGVDDDGDSAFFFFV